jgi:putative ABC transport system permease protein
LHCDNANGQGDHVLRFVLAQLRGRPRRTLALLAGVLVATTGFTVLSASTAVQRLQVQGTVNENARPAYDILVRPKGTRTTMEEQDGLVSPNHLSGTYGGITTRQLEQIRDIGNVEIAAPIAMLGYAKVGLEQTVDLTEYVDPTAERQLFRITPSILADRGLTVLDDAPHYVYLTRNRLVPQLTYPGEYADGTKWPDGLQKCVAVLEVEPDNRRNQVCHWPFPDWSGDNGTTTRERTKLTPIWREENGGYVNYQRSNDGEVTDRLIVRISWVVMVPAAAIDPDAEAELVGLDRTIVSGRYLAPGDRGARQADPAVQEGEPGSTFKAIPALFANSSYVDDRIEASVERMGADSVDAIIGREWNDWIPELAETRGTPLGEPIQVTADSLDSSAFVDASIFYRAGSPRYRTGSSRELRPEVVPADQETWTIRDVTVWFDQPPRPMMEDGFRSLTRFGGTLNRRAPEFSRTGMFDPTKLEGFSPLSQVPLETYQAPEAAGADERSRQLLGGKPLRPNSNPADYLASPPLILTTMAALEDVPPMRYKQDPISAIRIRVTGVTGVDERSQELVRNAAERIITTTGLDVDVTVGSSPQPRTVALPAGSGGRPQLTLTENWSRKGAAVAIVQASDRKSLVLFGLILLVCTLFLANAVTAAVRDRRRELAVLTCLGWPATRLAATVFAEVLGVGLIAGILAGGLAMGLAETAGAPITIHHALIALPVALGIATVAAAMPALLAAKARPLTALRPPARVRRARTHTSILGVALGNLWRVPGRTALGVTALAVGVGALTTLVLLALAFRDDVVGTLLGNAVALRVRGVDLLAAITAMSLGILMVADVLYINVRERATELATLAANGWPNHALFRLVGYEGLGMGVLGAVTGSALGLAGVVWFVGELHATMVWLAAGIAIVAVVVAGLAAIVPALVLRGLPLSALLAEE